MAKRLDNKAISYVFACFLSTSAPAIAQIEEIVVAAQKRDQSAQSVGLTLSVFDADFYEELTRGSLEGLAAQLSNVQAYATDSFLQSFHIRGLGLNEFQGQYDSPVGQHLDEVYISKPWMAARPRYDMQRVEVLKGPQGTVFGRNTTGGAVNFYTSPPSPDLAARMTVAIDEYERYRATGMSTGSLTDRLSGRGSFLAELGSGGPQRNLFSGRRHGEPELYDVRAQLLWEGPRSTVRTLLHGGIDRGEKVAYKGPGIFNRGAPEYCGALLAGLVSDSPATCSKYGGFAAQAGFPEAELEPDGAFIIDQNTPPRVNDTFYGGYARVEHEGRRGVLTSITAFEYYERIHVEDSQSDILDSSSTHYYNALSQLTQEVRFTRSPSDRRRYLFGLFYESDRLRQVDGSDLSEQPLPDVTPPFADQFFSQFRSTSTSAAVFANHELDLTSRVTVNAGARYTSDSATVTDAILGVGNLPQAGDERFVTPCLITTYPGGPMGSAACPFLGPVAPPFAGSRRDRHLSWRVGLEWAAASDLLFYSNFATGYRSGGYSLPLAGAATEFEPEDALSFEAGAKSLWFDRTLLVNASLFRYSVDKIQVNVDDPISPLVPITRNIGSQESLGFEVELEWSPNERWFLRQSIGRLRARYENTNRVISTYAGVVSLDGNVAIDSPEWTYAAHLRYRRGIAAGWDGSVGISYRWTASRYLEATNQPFDRAGAYGVANLRIAAFSPGGRWELALYGTNLLDEEYLTYINNLSFFKLDIFGAPRTVGASVTLRLN